VIEIKPPTRLAITADAVVVFLAGSIDMGGATRWQSDACTGIGDLATLVLNPRRDDWDASWRQSIEDAQFRTQVEWELDGLERADVIAMWFERDSKSPITLLELGLHARGGKVVVGCPEGFWRRGNVEVVCARFGVPLLDTFDGFIAAVRVRLGEVRERRGRGGGPERTTA
jgi:hypothetical protein